MSKSVKYVGQEALAQIIAEIKKGFAEIDSKLVVLEENGSSTAGTWLAKTDKISAYADGQLFLYKVAIAGASTTKLNITGSGGTALGAKTVYRYGTTKLTTQYGVGQYLLLIYNSQDTCFRVVSDYDANSYAYVRQYQSGANAAGTGTKYPLLARYNLTNKNASYDTAYSRFHTGATLDTSTGAIDAPALSVNGTPVLTAHQDISTKADLVNGKVPASQLPSYVDDIMYFPGYHLLADGTGVVTGNVVDQYPYTAGLGNSAPLFLDTQNVPIITSAQFEGLTTKSEVNSLFGITDSDWNGKRTLYICCYRKSQSGSNYYIYPKIAQIELASGTSNVSKKRISDTLVKSKIYICCVNNKQYRLSVDFVGVNNSATSYANPLVEISPSLALGTTSSTAYRGDLGAALANRVTALESASGVGHIALEGEWREENQLSGQYFGDGFLKWAPKGKTKDFGFYFFDGGKDEVSNLKVGDIIRIIGYGDDLILYVTGKNGSFIYCSGGMDTGFDAPLVSAILRPDYAVQDSSYWRVGITMLKDGWGLYHRKQAFHFDPNGLTKVVRYALEHNGIAGDGVFSSNLIGVKSSDFSDFCIADFLCETEAEKTAFEASALSGNDWHFVLATCVDGMNKTYKQNKGFYYEPNVLKRTLNVRPFGKTLCLHDILGHLCPSLITCDNEEILDSSAADWDVPSANVNYRLDSQKKIRGQGGQYLHKPHFAIYMNLGQAQVVPLRCLSNYQKNIVKDREQVRERYFSESDYYWAHANMLVGIKQTNDEEKHTTWLFGAKVFALVSGQWSQLALTFSTAE